MLCSGLLTLSLLSKLIRAAYCEGFCLNPFCVEVNEGFLRHNKNASDKNHTQFAARISLD